MPRGLKRKLEESDSKNKKKQKVTHQCHSKKEKLGLKGKTLCYVLCESEGKGVCLLQINKLCNKIQK